MPYYTILCHKCDGENDINIDICEHCGTPYGKTANVKRAIISVETQTLNERYQIAINDLISKGLRKGSDFFENLVLTDGKAIINTRFSILWEWLIHNRIEYQSYRRLVLEGWRERANYEQDVERSMAESSLFGTHIDIVYAALTLNSEGLLNYGEVSVILKTSRIEEITSLLEKNSYVFVNECMERGWHLSKKLPAGYFAPWERRGHLALVKCQTSIKKDLSPEEVADMILHSEKGNRMKDRFIELYIYGKINKSMVEKIKFPVSLYYSLGDEEKVQYEELKRKYVVEEY